MKFLIIAFAAVLGISSAQHWAGGPAAPVQDTPEVAAAKAAHFAAVARAQPQQPQAQWGQPQNQWNAPQQQGRYQGPLALPPGFDQNGAPLPVQDTPEVSAERAKHFSLTGGFGAPPQQPQWNAASQPQWNAPAPQPQWNAPAPQPQWNAPAPQQQWNAPAPQPQWNAPAPQPQWNQQAQNTPAGLPADTPEVAAAKAAHLAAHAHLHGRKRRSLIAPVALATAHAAFLPTAHVLAAHW